jgi:hypothetical protein
VFQFNAFGLLAWVAVTMSWGLAIVLFRVSLPGSVGRKLALLLVLEGVTLGSSDAGINAWLVSSDDFYAAFPRSELVQTMVHTLGDIGMLTLYPPFLAAALNTRLTRPFRNKRVQAALMGAGVMLFIALLLDPEVIGVTLLYLAMAATFIFALVASTHAWFISSGAARPRALIFAIAFGFRDICWTFVYTIVVWEIWWGIGDFLPEGPLNFALESAYIGGTFVAVPLIAYGILRTQLFDIDLRIRWTIKQSTLAATVVAIVFLLSEGADRFLSAELGNVGGLLAAAIVVFLLAPLQRFAEGVAATAMPNTQNTPEYTAFRKMQVYEAAITEALEGGISKKERALLVRLRDSLGISESDAEAIERDLQADPAGLAELQSA